jgi:branched-chain amino acid transport system permease protein
MLCGLRIDRIYMYTFAVGAAVAGAAGVLMAPLTHLYPDVGFVLFIKGMAAAVLGGLTSIPGAVLGGLLLGLAEQLAAGYLHSSTQDVVAFLVIMFALIFLPTGLLGARGLRKV